MKVETCLFQYCSGNCPSGLSLETYRQSQTFSMHRYIKNIALHGSTIDAKISTTKTLKHLPQGERKATQNLLVLQTGKGRGIQAS